MPKETKIASYQEPGCRMQLIKINDPEHYQIRKNRKILCNLKWETPARQKFNALIQKELLQTKLEL